eukprot:GGOE01036340.1.p1 GENE.GGOE01036340.1~~GGOE01036340.1.p1  ORF type:complete len:244 (-),score=65.86 GGOE01036340.1:237-911(-)
MEEHINQLKTLLASRRPPPGVSTLEELQQWLLTLPAYLEEWSRQHEADLFHPEGHDRSVSPVDSGLVLGEVYLVDDPRLPLEWENVRRDASPINWVLLGLRVGGARTAKTEVELVGRGEGGLRELIPHLDDTRVLFGGFRVTAIDDKTGVVSCRSKFVSIVWVGEKLGAMAKAKVTMQRADFAKIFHGAHLNLQISDPTEVTPEGIEAQLQSNAGAHKPSRYEF